MKQCLVFDMDGTLLDSMDMWIETGKNYMESLPAFLSPEQTALVGTMTPYQSADFLHKTFCRAVSPERMVEELNLALIEGYRTRVNAKDGAVYFVKEARRRGFGTAVATTTCREPALFALHKTGFDGLFDAVLTSSDVPRSKLFADVYLRATELLGGAVSRTWVFEDSLYAAKTASAHGFHTVGIFDAFSAGNEAELRCVCERFFSSWDEGKNFFEDIKKEGHK